MIKHPFGWKGEEAKTVLTCIGAHLHSRSRWVSIVILQRWTDGTLQKEKTKPNVICHSQYIALHIWCSLIHCWEFRVQWVLITATWHHWFSAFCFVWGKNIVYSETSTISAPIIHWVSNILALVGLMASLAFHSAGVGQKLIELFVHRLFFSLLSGQ